MHKSTRSKKIPTMVAVTIVGEDDAMYRALNKAILIMPLLRQR